MTDQPETAIDRIPLAHSVRYVARGLPEVPNQYGPGILAPSEITLTYRAAPDSGLGRVHAYVAGRIWVNGVELPLLPGGLYGQHYDDGLDGWPEWLTEEARLHDPDAPPASAGVAPATDQTEAICICGHTTQQHFEDVCQACDCGDYLEPDAARESINAMVRAAHENRLALSTTLGLGTGAPWDAIHERVADLRRVAGGEQHTNTQTLPARGDQVEQWLKGQRDEYEVRSSPQWGALDEVLDTYRLHADTGTPLDQHACEGQHCDCPAASAAPAAPDTEA